MVGRVGITIRFLIAKLVDHPTEEGIHIQNRVIIGIDPLLAVQLLMPTHSKASIWRKSRVTLIV